MSSEDEFQDFPSSSDCDAEEEPLHIVDYTCVTSLEKCVAAIETMLRDHHPQLSESDTESGFAEHEIPFVVDEIQDDQTVPDDVDIKVVLIPSHPLKMAKTKFNHHRVSAFVQEWQRCEPAVGDEASTSYFSHFLLLFPSGSRSAPLPLSRALISAALCAVESVGVHIPCFAAKGDVHREGYFGLARSPTTIRRFSLDQHAATPPQCCYLTGLVDLFQLNIGLQSKISESPGIMVAAKGAYRMRMKGRMDWEKVMEAANETASIRCSLPTSGFGTTSDPISHLAIKMNWDTVSERQIVDNSVKSTFDPLENPGKGIQLQICERNPCEYICVAAETIGDCFSSLFDVLDGESPSDMAPRATPTELLAMQDAIFDLATGASATDVTVQIENLHEDHSPKVDLRQRYFPGSFFSRFAHQASYLKHGDDVLNLWMMVTKELSSRIGGDASDWGTLLRVVGSSPALMLPLLHQKMQMLQCCGEILCNSEQRDDSESSFEFEELADGEDRVAALRKSRLELCCDTDNAQMLLCGVPMKIPSKTNIPVTSDELSSEHDIACARQLFADMCAFKHANRTVLVHFADFVKWYSPKDFIEHDMDMCDDHLPVVEEQSLLSPRMRSEDGEWWKLWRKSEPHEPSKLFDPLREAEDVCRWFESLSIESLLLHWSLHVTAACVHRIACCEVVEEIPALKHNLSELISQLSTELTWWENNADRLNERTEEARASVKRIMMFVTKMEVHVCGAVSLQAALSDSQNSSNTNDIVEHVYTNASQPFGSISSRTTSDSVPIQRELWEDKLADVFRHENNLHTTSRTFTLNTVAERPMNSAATEQLLTAHLASDGAFQLSLLLSECA